MRRRSADRSGGGRTPNERAPVARRAQECRRMVFDRPRPPESDSVRQRGHRLRHQRLAKTPGASLIMDATRETLAAAARGNVSIYGIDPRGLTNLADETIDSRLVSRRHQSRSRQSIHSEGASAVPGQPAAALRRHRRLRGRQQERFRDRLRSHRARQQLVLRDGVLPAERQGGQVPQDRGACPPSRSSRPRAPGVCHAEAGLARGGEAERQEPRRPRRTT